MSNSHSLPPALEKKRVPLSGGGREGGREEEEEEEEEGKGGRRSRVGSALMTV